MDKRIDLIIANLRDVYDPEIPVNIYDLGLIGRKCLNGDPVRLTIKLGIRA